MGEGDFHDTAYDHLRRSVPFFTVIAGDEEGDNNIVYTVDIYPSDDFKELYESNLAVIACSCVVLTVSTLRVRFFMCGSS